MKLSKTIKTYAVVICLNLYLALSYAIGAIQNNEFKTDGLQSDELSFAITVAVVCVLVFVIRQQFKLESSKALLAKQAKIP